jgi:hypothetical protein
MEGPAIRWPQPGGHREGPNAKMALWKTGQKNDTFKQFEDLHQLGAIHCFKSTVLANAVRLSQLAA